MNSFVIIKISLTNLVFESIISSKEFLLPNEFSEANFNAYKRISNWQPFMKRDGLQNRISEMFGFGCPTSTDYLFLWYTSEMARKDKGTLRPATWLNYL